MVIQKIKPALDNYIKKVTDSMNVEKIILFGSHARGDAKRDSDVDLLVISEDFATMDDDDRLKILYRLSVGFPYNLHVYGITPDELLHASPLTTLGEAKKKGITLSYFKQNRL